MPPALGTDGADAGKHGLTRVQHNGALNHPADIFGSHMKMHYKSPGLPHVRFPPFLRHFGPRSLSCGPWDPCIGLPPYLYLLLSLSALAFSLRHVGMT